MLSAEVATLTARHRTDLEALAAASERVVSTELQSMGAELKNKSKEVEKLQKKVRTLQTSLLAYQRQQEASTSSAVSKVRGQCCNMDISA
jgi:hypothetical protein